VPSSASIGHSRIQDSRSNHSVRYCTTTLSGPPRTALARYHESADDVPDGMSIPRWSWGADWSPPDPRPLPAEPTNQGLAPLRARARAKVACPISSRSCRATLPTSGTPGAGSTATPVTC